MTPWPLGHQAATLRQDSPSLKLSLIKKNYNIKSLQALTPGHQGHYLNTKNDKLQYEYIQRGPSLISVLHDVSRESLVDMRANVIFWDKLVTWLF